MPFRHKSFTAALIFDGARMGKQLYKDVKICRHTI